MEEASHIRIRVIIVEDDPDLGDLLRRFLGAAGMDVRLAGSSRDMEEALKAYPADVAVLDVNLPDENGFLIAARLRDRSSMRIVMLTARAQPDDRIMGRLLGADSYLTKPVQFRELEAVIRNLIRRSRDAPPHSAMAAGGYLAQGWDLNSDRSSLRTPKGASVPLTAGELTLLSCFLARTGSTIARGDIIAALGHDPDAYDDRALSTLVTRLRRKVEKAAGERLPIKSVRSVGYVFSPLPL